MTALFVPNDLETLLKVPNPAQELNDCLVDIIKGFPPVDGLRNSDDMGLYIGPTAIAYLFLHLSKSHPDLVIESKTSKEWAGLYLEGPRPEPKVNEELCGILCEGLSYWAVSAAYTQDLKDVEKLVEYVPQLCNSKGFNEWCYGRSGTLYMLRMVRTWVPASAELINPALKQLGDCVIANGLDWPYRGGKRYFGAGHGDIGIITQLVLSNPSYAPQLENKLSSLLDHQLPSGTWPHNYDAGSKELVQFCHGAPGYVISLNAIRSHFPNLHSRIDSAVERARECTWREGIIRKEPNICHGVTGNAFAFPPGEKREHFLAFGKKDMLEVGREKGWWESCDYGLPYSLGFGGAPGRAWGWMSMNKTGGEYITYNDC